MKKLEYLNSNFIYQLIEIFNTFFYFFLFFKKYFLLSFSWPASFSFYFWKCSFLQFNIRYFYFFNYQRILIAFNFFLSISSKLSQMVSNSSTSFLSSHIISCSTIISNWSQHSSRLFVFINGDASIEMEIALLLSSILIFSGLIHKFESFSQTFMIKFFFIFF